MPFLANSTLNRPDLGQLNDGVIQRGVDKNPRAQNNSKYKLKVWDPVVMKAARKPFAALAILSPNLR